ncbi:energy-coupled thiamine transporter ThiT [Bhargavaea beijingensis]|uniref:Thiamine transporter n=1 Tax=Bhargavaea beijingensis TaxID=426756 RepID=A0A1G7B9Z4_9BACL|nr:energy-coupled thiamine transporter ThiT [Bhargavaea beijingensis]MCW1928415.1 energy-coupled thiamine transporter ThiT [Bhargavaea beijingensis]RSK32652.1 energy-coupled thiamine transporter ThiT [Bhargavaea beijingensis]SDE23948.1 thiamine transporter [Bhargavaea beijingensis]
MQRNKRLQFLIEVAIFSAIGFVLDQISIKLWFQGGSISLTMVPIVLMAFRWGLGGGLLTGLILGILQTFAGAYIIHPVQGFLDYIAAFVVIGAAALLRPMVLRGADSGDKVRMVTGIVIGTVIGGLLRYIMHVLSGVVFFGAAALDAGDNVWWYSIVYNAGYMIPSIILTAAACALLFSTAPRLLKR